MPSRIRAGTSLLAAGKRFANTLTGNSRARLASALVTKTHLASLDSKPNGDRLKCDCFSQARIQASGKRRLRHRKGGNAA